MNEMNETNKNLRRPREEPRRDLEPKSRKEYRKPGITEWGTVTDLTKGGLQGFDDMGFTGTSTG